MNRARPDPGMPVHLRIVLLLAALSCATTVNSDVCTDTLFGQPTATTGLDASACGAVCACEDEVWEPRALSEETLVRLEGLVLSNPRAPLVEDPYERTPDLQPQDGVCATRWEAGTSAYELHSYASAAEAQREGAEVTHTGACGQCSGLQNLAVYARYPDLTDPVRDCGIDAIFAGIEANITCLMALGFDEPCAQIWAYNTTHTREVCLEPCLAMLDEPHHEPDGTLNACIQCDEDQSGPVFKAVSGRTRRNSGLPSALCRPCESVSRVSHEHWEEALGS